MSDQASASPPPETDEQCYRRLAAHPRAAYDRCREQEAKRLKIRVTTLDEEVERVRVEMAMAVAGKEPAVEPWPEPVNGAHLLELIAATFDRFCVLPQFASVALAVWIIQTYCFRLFDFVAIIAVWSPEPECGKG